MRILFRQFRLHSLLVGMDIQRLNLPGGWGCVSRRCVVGGVNTTDHSVPHSGFGMVRVADVFEQSDTNLDSCMS